MILSLLCIVAKTKSTKASIAAPIVATTTVPFVKRWIHTLIAIATSLIVLAFLPTLATCIAP